MCCFENGLRGISRITCVTWLSIIIGWLLLNGSHLPIGSPVYIILHNTLAKIHRLIVPSVVATLSVDTNRVWYWKGLSTVTQRLLVLLYWHFIAQCAVGLQRDSKFIRGRFFISCVSNERKLEALGKARRSPDSHPSVLQKVL